MVNDDDYDVAPNADAADDDCYYSQDATDNGSDYANDDW